MSRDPTATYIHSTDLIGLHFGMKCELHQEFRSCSLASCESWIEELNIQPDEKQILLERHTAPTGASRLSTGHRPGGALSFTFTKAAKHGRRVFHLGST